ncbi:MAG: hypothetical protein ABFD96_14140 [Armatimonadia bacterium]
MAVSFLVWLLYYALVYWIAGQTVLATKDAETYVSDAPELRGDTTPEWLAGLNKRIHRYLSSTGVSPSHATDLRFAYRPYDLLARFRLSDSDLRLFLSDKKKIARSLGETQALIGNPPEYRVYLDPDGLTHFPVSEDNEQFFGELSWWPIPPESRSSYAVYRATLKWDTVEWHIGAAYHVLVNHATNELYLLAG